MYNLPKLTLSLIMITLIVLGLSSPVAAQEPPPPTLYVDAPSSVNVSTEFDIIIGIRDIPAGWGMTNIELDIQWDPNDLEYIECEFLNDDKPTWSGGSCGTNVNVPGKGGGSGGSAPPYWTEDAEWFRFRFHCLQAGPAVIKVFDIITVLAPLTGGASAEEFPETVTVTVNQVAPVGGVATPINKLEILAPYIALAGLIAVVSVVYVIKKRKD